MVVTMSLDVEMVPTTINHKWEIILPAHRAARGEVWDYWEAERMASMRDHIGPGDVVYDIGAEEGDMPGLWATWGAKVALFEPNPRVWPNMRVIWEANELPAPIGCFVGFAGATDTFNQESSKRLADTGWVDGWPPCAYGPVIGDHGFANLCERPDIPVITLNTAATMIEPPTVITIDVEGSELEVLAGAAAYVLSELRPKLWVSVHPPFMADMYGQTPDDLHGLLVGHGYRGEMVADDHEQHWMYLPEEA